MNWTTVIFSAGGGACIALAMIHLFMWANSRDAWVNLLFSIASFSAATCAIIEMIMIHARTPEAYGELLRWLHIPVAMIAITIVWFIRFYLQEGRVWLAWLISGLRVLVLVVNFSWLPNASFQVITSLSRVSFLGETFSLPVGAANPWRFLIAINTLLMVAYVLDAAISTWKQGRRRQSLALCGPILFAVVLAGIFSRLMVLGILPSAFISMSFLLIVIAMSFELSFDLFRAKQLSRDLFKSRERMNLAARAANLGLWEWDLVNNEFWANQTSRARIGVGASERVTFERVLESVHPGDREVVQQATDKLLEGTTGDLRLEYRAVVPDGAVRWVANTGQVVRDLSNKPLRIHGVSMDITERKKIELSLEKSEAHLRRAQEIAHSGSWELDLVGGELTWSDEVYRMFGADREISLSYEDFLEYIPPEDQISVDRSWKAALHGAPYDIEHRILVGDTVKWIREKAEIEFDETGRAIRGVGIVQDITDRKRIELQLLDYQRHLKALASQLTLAEEGTRQKIAADLHDNIGHSLALARIQLSGILESTSGLETSILVKDISALLLKALQDTRQLIFDLGSRSLEHFGLGPAISEWLEERIERPHRLKTEFVNELPDNCEEKINKDIRVLLFRNLRELLTNVVKHARARLVRVCLSCDDKSLRLSVEDDGIGFDPGESGNVMFSKGGFGLLSIRTRMINMGGTFDIRAEPGKGCRLVLTVPMNTDK